MSRPELSDRLIQAAPALFEFVEEFIAECERNNIRNGDMPLLRKARFVAAQAGDRTRRDSAQPVKYARRA